MTIRIISAGGDGDGGWLLEYERQYDREYGIRLTVVVALPREDGNDCIPLQKAIASGASLARFYFKTMITFNESASATHGET